MSLPFEGVQAPAALPIGWTEHTTLQGRTYYYHTETKKSTYTRPVRIASGLQEPGLQKYHPPTELQEPYTDIARPRPTIRHDHAHDRPKSQSRLPGCAPWVLVTTRLGRRFVHNLDTGESLWRFPKNVMAAVVQFDSQMRHVEQRHHSEAKTHSSTEIRTDFDLSPGDERDEVNASSKDGMAVAGVSADDGSSIRPDNIHLRQEQYQEAVEFEEVETVASDDEAPETGGNVSIRADDKDKGDLEFGFDDMEYQLEEMQQQEALEDGFDGGMAARDKVDLEQSRAAFFDLLDDLEITPYSTWDTVVNHDKIMDDARYVMIPDTKSRREAFDAWSRDRIQKLQMLQKTRAQVNPRIPYLAFLEQHATPKLFWPEFRRRHKRQDVINGNALSDKERENIYRELVNRRKHMSVSKLKDDLLACLNSISSSPNWHRHTTLESLPDALLCDIRYYTVRPDTRETIIEEFISKLPERCLDLTMTTTEHEEALLERQKSKQRQEAALLQRKNEVQLTKRQQEKDRVFGKTRLEQADEELTRALQIGKDGLRHAI